MADELLSVFDIASRLNVHVRTVRNYVRDGRLRAIRVGKQYRISREDLEAFTGSALPQTASERARREGGNEVSSIVQIDAISPDRAAELERALAAHVVAERDRGATLNAECVYDREIGRLKVVVLGNLDSGSTALKFIGAWLES